MEATHTVKFEISGEMNQTFATIHEIAIMKLMAAKRPEFRIVEIHRRNRLPKVR